MKDFLFVDLSSLTPGKPFAGFAAGSFVDMNGREVEFKPDRLKEFLANTVKAIRAAMKQGMPGLPIDARQHDKGDAAGWIVDASEGSVVDSDGNTVPVIMLAAEWTKLGLELLKEKILANFSPTVDLRNSVIRGGSLTNWPASVDGNGVPLFPAVELSSGMYQLVSLDSTAMEVRKAWGRQQGDVDTYVIEVFDDHVIAMVGERTFRVDYSIEGDRITFASRDEWTEVKQDWVDAQEESAGGESSTGDLNDSSSRDDRDQQEVIDMLTREELAQVVAEQVQQSLKSELQQFVLPARTSEGPAPTTEGTGGEFDVLKFLEMSDASTSVVDAFKQQMLDQYEVMKSRAAQEAAEMIGRIRRESDIAEFAQAATAGTNDVPYGLPVDLDDLKEFLARLQPADYQFAKKLLTDFRTHGRVHFAELGHGKRMQGQTVLSAELAAQLKAYVSAGGAIDEWFRVAGIGDPEEFNLTDFVGKEK